MRVWWAQSWAMYGFGAIIGCLFGGTLSDRFGRQSMIIIGEIGAAAALLAFPYSLILCL